MKIAIVNKFFFLKGGQETLMFQEADMLGNLGHEIAFFSMHHRNNSPDYKYSNYFADYIELSDLGSGFSLNQKLIIAKNFIYNKEVARRFNEFLKDFKPDIIHCHGIAHQLSTSILDIAKEHKIPVVQTLHDYQLVCPNYTFMLSSEKVCAELKCIKGNYYNCILYKCVKKSLPASILSSVEMYINYYKNVYVNTIEKFIAPSHFMYDIMLKSGLIEEKLVYIPNFVSIGDTDMQSQNNHYFLFIGRLSFEKGLLTLLKTFKELPEVKLKIAGTGPLESELKRYQEQNKINNVEFLGFIEGSQIPKYIRNCTAIIIPSEWYENAPMSILEAFSYEKPVIGSQIGGIPEMIIPDLNGYLFIPGDSNDLKKSILKFTQDENLTFKLGKNAKKFVEDKFNKQIHIEKLLELYNSLI